MKYSLSFLSICILSFIIVFSCSTEEEESITPVVQAPEPEPAPVEYTLTVSSAEGGTVSTEGGTYEEGTEVTIAATPSEGYRFTGWEGNDSTNESLTITLNTDQTLQALFELIPIYTLTVATSEGGTVSTEGGEYEEGAEITITATSNQGYNFLSWSDGSSENPKTINLNSNISLEATFGRLDPIYLDENGITLRASDFVEIGKTYSFNGEEFTIVDNRLLKKIVSDKGDLTKIITTKVNNMEALFSSNFSFNDRINSWDTSNVTNMKSMFYGARDFNQDISSWDTSNVINMERMFNGAINFNQNISIWNTSNVINMSWMFNNASSFNQDISGWNTSNVEDMEGMFFDAILFNQEIGSWDTSNVANMKSLFNGAISFNKYIGGWNTSNVIDMGWMFYNATSFNQNLSDWNTSNVENMFNLFYNSKTFNQEIGSWNVSKVKNMGWMFYNASSFNRDISSWDTSSVENMEGMFYNASSFNQKIGDWNTSKVNDMNEMFLNAKAFNQNISNWCVSNIRNMPYNFSLNSELTSANTPLWSYCPATYSINVSSINNDDYLLSGNDREGDFSNNDPKLQFKIGDNLKFLIDAQDHPFYLKTVAGKGIGFLISDIANNGTQNGLITWKPLIEGTYFYQCRFHDEMVGTIEIID